jgi:hypothetical protein
MRVSVLSFDISCCESQTLIVFAFKLESWAHARISNRQTEVTSGGEQGLFESQASPDPGPLMNTIRLEEGTARPPFPNEFLDVHHFLTPTIRALMLNF